MELPWQGKVSAHLAGTAPDQAWPLLKDFCNFHKLLPALEECRLIEGAAGELGCVRHCRSRPDVIGDGVAYWAEEKLLSVDDAGRSFRYEVTDSNMGFRRYFATMKVSAVAATGGSGCLVDWSFEADPVEGWSEESLASFLEGSLQDVARGIGEAVAEEDKVDAAAQA